MRLSMLFPALTASALTCTVAVAADTVSLDAAGRRAAVEDAARALTQRYVYPDVGLRTAGAIREALVAGQYDAITDTAAFAERLTADLRAVAGDKHLRVDRWKTGRLNPQDPKEPLSPRSEAGVVRADRLAGNIGYIEVAGFPPIAAFRPAIDRAMASLADTRALVIDLRRNGGGSPDSEVYLASYLLDPGIAVVVSRIIWRTPGTRRFQVVNYPNSPTPLHYVGRPVYVLTSERTFSAAEALAYEMQALKRAKVVGEITGGGANPGGITLLRSGLSLFVPSGRNENPVTGGSWEGVGVHPDIATTAAEALKAAVNQLGNATNSSNIEDLSTDLLFEPDAEPALRRLLVELADRKSPERVASRIREQQSRARQMLRSLGPLQSMTFRGVDVDGYDVFDARFANGALTFLVFLDAEGRAVIAEMETISDR